MRRYAAQIAQWLAGEGVQLIVIACNTATAHALTHLREIIPVPVIGVVDPGARAAVRATDGGPVGVIGTSGTIASGAYERAIHTLTPGLVVHSRACPLLVPLIEAGWIDHHLLAQPNAAPSLRFVASDSPGRFLVLGRRFLDNTMAHVEHVAFS